MPIPCGNTNSQKMKSIIIVEDDRLRDKLHFDLNNLGHEVEMLVPEALFQGHEYTGSAAFCFVDSQILKRWNCRNSIEHQFPLTYISLENIENNSDWEMQSAEFQGLMLGRSYRIEELKLTLNHASKIQGLLANLGRHDLAIKRSLETEIIGQSKAAGELRSQIAIAISKNKPIMLFGEEGSGKRGIARLIHITNPETKGSFIGYDCRCRSTSELLNLLEESLHRLEDHSHTHARDTVYISHIEHLSERYKNRISEIFARLPSSAQLILASSTHKLQTHHESPFFNELTGILSAGIIELLPLKERQEDIALEASHYVEQISVRTGVPIPMFSKDAMIALESYDWPGNSHELYSVCEQICSLISNGLITQEIVLPWLSGAPEKETSTVSFTLREMEKRLIEATFHRFGGNREQTAGALKIGIRTLCGKLREYGYPPRGGPGSNRVVSEKAA